MRKMKNTKTNKLNMALWLAVVLVVNLSCERELSDDAVLAQFPSTGEIFTDNFEGMGSDFYLPFLGSKLDAFSVDTNEGFESNASFRVDVPNANDPTGNYAGAILRVDGSGRNLSGFNVLTFYAKASRGVSIDAVGFGQDFLEDKYLVTANNFSVGTNWQKYYIPIPDPSVLVNERGMFWYAAGTQGTGGSGYVIWFDEIKFEKLGTIAQPRPGIANGINITIDSFIGVTAAATGLIQTFSLPNGLDRTISPATSYFQFESSDPSVATVDASGKIAVLSGGTAEITATLAGVQANGSITINSLGDFVLAPTPTRDPSQVISIFSDHYTNVPVDFYNGFWAPFQTTQSADFVVNGNNILNYTNFNFVGHQFANPTVNASTRPNLHINMYIPGTVPANLDFLISIVDFGPSGVDGGGDNTRQQVFFNASNFVANTWATLEIPITLANKSNLGLIIFENVNASTLRNFYLDNVYFYAD